MDYFYNRPADVVDEMLDGLARIAPVVRSPRDSGMRLVIDRAWLAGSVGDRVAVLSGGGAGHEPSHAGFVGTGMLAAAISGDVFASPSVEAVLAAIRATCGAAGCLLVVKNYTGDRLNFGLAAERAAAEGYRVKSVIVADDVALPDARQPRGLAGTVLVHKIAGFHAARGADLDTVAAAAQAACDGLCSMSLSLASCTLPGHKREPRSAELGLGIHNEPGVAAIEPASAADAVARVLEPLLAAARARSDRAETEHGAKWVLLLNNMGGCSTQEMGILLDETIRQIGEDQLAAAVVPAPLMTSIDMHGFSVTLLAASQDVMTALEYSVEAIGWPGMRRIHPIEHFSPEPTSSEPRAAGRRDATREAALSRMTSALTDAREALDALDARAGDGDAGATFAAGARAIDKALAAAQLSTGEDAALAQELGDLLARDMGGSSGVLLSIFCHAVATALRQVQGEPEGQAQAEGQGENNSHAAALQRGVERMQHYGGAQPGDRTLLDALVPAIAALAEGADMQAAAAAARQGADATADMRCANAGRSAQVRESELHGVVDPGAEAMALIWQALAG